MLDRGTNLLAISEAKPSGYKDFAGDSLLVAGEVLMAFHIPPVTFSDLVMYLAIGVVAVAMIDLIVHHSDVIDV